MLLMLPLVMWMSVIESHWWCFYLLLLNNVWYTTRLSFKLCIGREEMHAWLSMTFVDLIYDKSGEEVNVPHQACTYGESN